MMCCFLKLAALTFPDKPVWIARKPVLFVPYVEKLKSTWGTKSQVTSSTIGHCKEVSYLLEKPPAKILNFNAEKS
jgi:hypothetical protein